MFLRVAPFLFRGSLVGLLLASLWPEACASAENGVDGELGARTFYVDSETGRDSNDGQAPDQAWQSLDQVNAAELKPGDAVRFKSGGVWRGSLVPASGDADAPITYTSFGQGPKPRILGSLPRSRTEDWVQVRENVWATLPQDIQLQSLHTATRSITDPLDVDVGNIIFDDGVVCGWKKWSLDELSKPYDYYYERTAQRVYLYLEAAPASRHRSIELALARHIVSQSGKHHVVFDGLAFSFEYWNHPETAVTQNIRFLHNTCVRAGRGWAHAQRPDPNGSHLMFYSNTAATSGIEVKYNIFYDHTDWGSRYSSGWRVLPDMDYNLWFSETGVMAYWFRDKIATFDEYRQTTGLDAHSRFADPQFVDAARRDYRLRPDSPARTLRPDGGPAGAEMR